MKYGLGVKGQSSGTRKEVAPAGITKFDYGKVMAACLAYLILNQSDATAIGLFDTAMKQCLPRTGNLASLHNIMTTLASFQPSRKTGIGGVLHNVAGQIHRKGLVILISDLFDDEQAVLDGIQHLRFGGNEVIVFHTMDPYELEFPFQGLVEFEGLENAPKGMTRPREGRKSYMKQVEQVRPRLPGGCQRL